MVEKIPSCLYAHTIDRIWTLDSSASCCAAGIAASWPISNFRDLTDETIRATRVIHKASLGLNPDRRL